ncbi:MAG: helix-turn-helix domain-containing protein [Eubacteriales bacterium]|nr:helix-turn-helix domain-containing protein [Eubacteriales bacterium]
MDAYLTGGTIKALREQKKMTQAELAGQLCVSDKAVSKWETGKGFPDIALLDSLAAALQVSITELLTGAPVVNRNVACNLTRSKLYVCPVCGNVIHATGDAMVSCCGITLPALEAEAEDEGHVLRCERIEDEYYVTVEHDMTKQHYISFLAFVTADRVACKKLYPEGNAEARFFIRGHGMLYGYCNRHGLFARRV